VSGTETGSYSCQVSSACGNASSVAAQLTIAAAGGGDANGLVDGNDIQAFVAVLLSGNHASSGFCASDMNQDAAVNLADIPLFVAAILGN
jgi:hypothetical protein